MIITEIRKRRGTLYLLVLDGEPAMTVDARTFDESPYRPGGAIDDGQLRELLEQSARPAGQGKGPIPAVPAGSFPGGAGG